MEIILSYAGDQGMGRGRDEDVGRRKGQADHVLRLCLR